MQTGQIRLSLGFGRVIADDPNWRRALVGLLDSHTPELATHGIYACRRTHKERPLRELGGLDGLLNRELGRRNTGFATASAWTPDLAFVLSVSPVALARVFPAWSWGSDLSLSVSDQDSWMDWASNWFERACSELCPDWGGAYHEDEYWNKNIGVSQTALGRTTKAIGVDVSKGLSGIYWGNYFGSRYVDLIGRDRLLGAPAWREHPLGEGHVVWLDSSARRGKASSFKEREDELRRHLGAELFFDRRYPESPLRTVDWSSEIAAAESRYPRHLREGDPSASERADS